MLHRQHSLAIWLLLASVCAAETRSSESSRPRGVGPEFAKYYKHATEFACISNPSLRIPVARVNDDYCDCPDGSDEPGTSACSYVSPLSPETPSIPLIDHTLNLTASLPGFYCKNKGHQPSYVPFLAVNDGKCDYDGCCDGSDEWQAVGGTKCPDKCKDIGKEWRRKDEIRKKALTAANKRKKQLLSQAAQLREEVSKKIVPLEAEIKERQSKLERLEAELEAVEKQEKLRIVKAPGKASSASVLAGLAKDRVEELRESLIDVREQRNSQKERVKELETILTAIKEDHNPNFNDQGLKRQLETWDNYVTREKSDWNEAEDRDLDEIIKPDSADLGINWAEWESSEQDQGKNEIDTLYSFSAYLPDSFRLWTVEKMAALRTLLVNNGILAPDNTSDQAQPESPVLTNARNAVSTARADLTSSQNSLSESQNDLGKDYGTDDIFRALKGRCSSIDVGEYTYEHCFMDRTKQKAKRGGGDTTMGNFVRLDKEWVDEEVDVEGKGLGTGERIVMKYENGQGCWNGPSRSTKVILGCSSEEEIWKVSETEKCVYEIHQGTVVACDVLGGGSGKDRKEEL
ncbi:MAG: hypothetical protein Q9160_001325 [Pyrenula sp. 1 TL-2023]